MLMCQMPTCPTQPLLTVHNDCCTLILTPKKFTRGDNKLVLPICPKHIGKTVSTHGAYLCTEEKKRKREKETNVATLSMIRSSLHHGLSLFNSQPFTEKCTYLYINCYFT